jgi:hypothetical protein
MSRSVVVSIVPVSPEAWIHGAVGSARRLHKRLGTPDRQTADCMARAFRAALCPRMTAGRKADATTLRAAEIWTEGMSLYAGSHVRTLVRQYQRQLWQMIYREVFPELGSMDRLTRQYQTLSLRRNAKSLLCRRGGNTIPKLRRHTKTPE